MTNKFRNINDHIPRPDYSEEAEAIVEEYRKALREIRMTLLEIPENNVNLRAMLYVKEEQIKAILRELDGKAIGMTEKLILQAAEDGIANTLYSLGYADSIEQAAVLVAFGAINRPYVEAVLADTQADLLAITKNTERKTIQLMRRAMADGMREVFAQGGGQGDDVYRNVMSKIIDDGNVAIIDSAGRKWKLETYVRMATETKAMTAHRDAAINAGIEEGSHYALISSHGATDACQFYENTIVSLVGGSNEYNAPYVEDLPRNDVFHPRCKHVLTPIPDPSVYIEEGYEVSPRRTPPMPKKRKK